MEDDKWLEYTELKNKWLEEHKDATPQEIEDFCIQLADKLDI